MTYHAEVAKEYLRDAFHSGALDVTSSYESVRGFVHIFAGEMDALVAISHCRFLTADEVASLMKIAKPTDESLRHYRAWFERIKQ
jgi:hypothetical protein